MEKAMFGAGCFWGVEAAFKKVSGVQKTTVGYSGGNLANPTYEQVCRGDTGHAEVVLLEFDPDVVSYEALLEVFWGLHDPTTPNRQGPDVGAQYRSAVFYFSDSQKETAERKCRALTKSGAFADPIVTEIVKAKAFFRAEAYHQDYLAKRG